MNKLAKPKLPQKGDLYRHYKGTSYEVVEVALLEESMKPAVVYMDTETKAKYIRTLEGFTNQAKVQSEPGKIDLVDRFKYEGSKEETQDDPTLLEELMQVRHEFAQAAATIERLKVEKEAIHDLRGRNASEWKIPEGQDSVLIDKKVYNTLHEKITTLEAEVNSLERLSRRLAEAKQEVKKQRRSIFPDKLDININVNGNISDEVIEKAMKQLEEKYKNGGIS